MLPKIKLGDLPDCPKNSYSQGSSGSDPPRARLVAVLQTSRKDDQEISVSIATEAPNLFVVGTHKAGTTFLCDMLGDHPDISFSRPKEPFFFNRDDVTADTYAAYLTEYFPSKDIKKKRARFFAEGSTAYFQSRSALENMCKLLGANFKAIVVLRQPVAKCLSYYMHHLRRGRFDASHHLLDKSIVRTGMYAKHAERWIDALGFERFFPMKYDTLQQSPMDFVNGVVRFIAAEPLDAVPNLRINAGYQIVRRGDYLVPIVEGGSGEQPRFLMSDIMELQQTFTKDIKRTQDVTGLDLSRWLELPEFGAVADGDES